MLLIIAGAIIGYLFGHFIGLLIGGGIGYALNWYLRRKLLGGVASAQSELLDATFSIMGALCKADRVVTRDEIRVAERIFDHFHLSATQREAAKAAFNRGKSPGFDLDEAVRRFAGTARGHRSVIQVFLQVQITAIAADGDVHPAEHEMLVHVARGLGLSEADVERLEALLRATAAGPSAGGAPSAQRLDDAYAALGLSSNASDTEVKRAYRKLIGRNHPDRLAANGLPDSMREMAEERSRKINAAYDLIKEQRQFT